MGKICKYFRNICSATLEKVCSADLGRKTIFLTLVSNELNEIFHRPVIRQDGQQCKTKYLHALKCGLQLYIRGEFHINISDTAYFSRVELLKTMTKLESSDGIEDCI